MERPNFPTTAKADPLQTLGRELQQVLGAWQQQWVEGIDGMAAIAPQDWAILSQLEADLATLCAPSATCQSLETQLNRGLPAQWTGSATGSVQPSSTVFPRQLQATPSAVPAAPPKPKPVPFTLAVYNPYASLTEMDLSAADSSAPAVRSDRPPASPSRTTRSAPSPPPPPNRIEAPLAQAAPTTPAATSQSSTVPPPPPPQTQLAELAKPSPRPSTETPPPANHRMHAQSQAPSTPLHSAQSPQPPNPPSLPEPENPTARSPAPPVKGLRDFAQWLATDQAAAQTALQTSAPTDSPAVSQDRWARKEPAAAPQTAENHPPQLRTDSATASPNAAVTAFPVPGPEEGKSLSLTAFAADSAVLPEPLADSPSTPPDAPLSPLGNPPPNPVSALAQEESSRFDDGLHVASPPMLPVPLSEPSASQWSNASMSTAPPIPTTPDTPPRPAGSWAPDNDTDMAAAARSPAASSPSSSDQPPIMAAIELPSLPFSPSPSLATAEMDLGDVMAAIAQQLFREYRQFYGD